MRLEGRLGPLRERDFRLLFSATMISTAGDQLATIALAFAVLELPGGSPTDLGIVLAVRQGVQAGVLVFGGVLSDRLPRPLMLTGASLVQGAAQSVTAAFVLSGDATVTGLVAAQAVYGLGNGLVIPAEVGLIPQTVSAGRLRQANALQGLSRNLVSVAGPAVGGAIVVAGTPGVALAIDAGSFFLCAVLLARIRIPRAIRAEATSYLHELREGWREFTSKDWLVTTIAFFGIANMFFSGCWNVLGPAIARTDLGGAGAWAAVLTAGGVGAVVGGLVSLRVNPRRPLLASCLAASPFLLQLAGLALQVPVAVLAFFTFLSGIGLAIHLTLWFTVFQQQIPEHAQSRVSSYDALFSFVLVPAGLAIVGPLASAVGTSEAIWLSTAVAGACFAAIVSRPSVRRIERAEAVAVPAAS